MRTSRQNMECKERNSKSIIRTSISHLDIDDGICFSMLIVVNKMNTSNPVSTQIQQKMNVNNTTPQVKKAGGLFQSKPVQPSPVAIAYIPPPGDKVKDVDLYRKTKETNADFRRNAILAGLFGIAAFIHSMLVQTKLY